MAYKVIFNWSGPDYDKGKLKSVSCQGQEIPDEHTGKAQFAADWVQLRKAEAYEACLTVNTSNTLRLHKGQFLYMDVGKWLDGEQTFGVVCGHEAAICRYQPGSSSKLSVVRYQEAFLNDFLRHMKGVSVINRMPILGPRPAHSDHLYIILPDMHVPEAPPLEFAPPPYRPGRAAPPPYVLEEIHHSTRNPDFVAYEQEEEARKKKYAEDNPNLADFQKWSERDSVFNSRGSIAAMCSFLDQVRKFPEANGSDASQVSIVQIGDMYELWAARPCLFEKTDPKFPYVDLAHDLNRTEPDLAREVGTWVGGTHLLWPNLFYAFDACEDSGMDTSFLHGNHDNYMILSEVVNAANQYIKNSVSQGQAEGIPGEWTKNVQPTKVHKRRRPKIEDGIFIEHGQRVDAYNRDGSREGHEMTQKAVGEGWFKEFKRPFDPTRRNTAVYGAAAYWHKNDRKFGLYVQGHTHDPVLDCVEIYHTREDTKQVMTGRGPISIQSRTPLDVPEEE